MTQPPVSQLHAGLAVFPCTFFPDKLAYRMLSGSFSAALFGNPPTAKTKAELTYFKLATFSGVKSARGCCRHDAGVVEVTGCELDYDKGTTTMQAAAAKFTEAGVYAILYETPSSTLEAPRWRVMLPFAQGFKGTTDQMRMYRSAAVRAAEGILGETVAGESHTLSQAFYYGVVVGKQWNWVETPGRCIDVVKDIKSFIKEVKPNGPQVNDSDRLDTGEAVRNILTGAEFHTSLIRLAARYVGQGTKGAAVVDLLTGLMNNSQEAGSERWHDRMQELPRVVDSAILKYGPDKPPALEINPSSVVAAAAFAAGGPSRSNVAATDMPFPGGLVGEIGQYIFNSSPVPNKPFAVMAGLLAVSVLSLNRYQVPPYYTRLNLYCAAVGVTGSGKDAPPAKVNQMLYAAGLGEVCTEGVSSGVALQRALTLAPHKTIFYWQDEIWEMIQAAGEHGGQPYKRELTATLMTLFGRAGKTFGGRKYANPSDNIETIENPFVIFGGATTPARFMEALSNKHVADGFLNRLIVFQSAEKFGLVEPTQGKLPDAMRTRLKALAPALPSLPDAGSEVINIKRQPDVDVYLKALEKESRAVTGSFAALWSRAFENAVKVAGILAVGVDHEEPIITMRQAEWAVGLVRGCLEVFSEQLDQNLADNAFHADCNKAMAIIRDPRRHSGDTRWGRFTSKGMPRGLLTRALRVEGRKVSEIVGHLAETGQIEVSEVENITVYRAV
jgi:hypothetical protein